MKTLYIKKLIVNGGAHECETQIDRKPPNKQYYDKTNK
jgi:hypothetical protein